MSMSSGHWYGYGLSSYDLNQIPHDKLASFIQKRPQLFKEWWEDVIFEAYIEGNSEMPSFEEASLEQIYEGFSDYENSEHFEPSIFICIYDAMREETDIYLDYANFEGDVGIILPQMMPWHMSEQEKSLSSLEDLQKIFQPFLCELGIPNTKINFVEVEWRG